MKIVKVTARDWAQYSEMVDVTYKFEPTVATVVGFIVQEDEDQLVLSHQLFPDKCRYSEDRVRYTTVIPKEMIKDIEVLKDDPNDNEQPKGEQNITINVNESQTPGKIGLEIEKEIKAFLKSSVGRKIIRQINKGKLK